MLHRICLWYQKKKVTENSFLVHYHNKVKMVTEKLFKVIMIF